jgi:DNA-binding transcriptional regulator YhcF (GntR family)
MKELEDNKKVKHYDEEGNLIPVDEKDSSNQRFDQEGNLLTTQDTQVQINELDTGGFSKEEIINKEEKNQEENLPDEQIKDSELDVKTNEKGLPPSDN